MNERYSRLTLIPWWDQERLRSASALVVGTGALGNEIIKSLALLGLGKITVVDMDRIESSNLSRSVLFRASDVGSYKAEVIARNAQQLNPDVEVVPLIGKFEEKVGLNLLRQSDLVFAGLDSRLARLNLGRACRLVGKPWIDGAIEALHGIARVFGPEGPCYECTLNEIDLELIEKRKSCALISKEEAEQGKIPTTPTMASIVAGFQVQEGVKLLHDNRNLPILVGRAFFINGLTHDSYSITYSEKKECPSHEKFEQFIEIDGSSHATIEEILSMIKEKVPEVRSVSLRREVVIAERCVPCKTEKTVGVTPQKWIEGKNTCQTCHKNLQPILAQDLSDFSKLAQTSLNQLGVPENEILSAIVGESIVGVVLKSESEEIKVRRAA
ncbi:MAG: ThiF family adenylyltransferase [Proteobacteria bacterium]|nr:ThiF family adenylyltransferase [Pseudomonadota bacterium]